jgi:hypothetical protein
MADEEPYQLSRAALRRKHGARSIGYAGQSARDTTPSGRIARETGVRDFTPSGIAASAAERGKTAREAEAESAEFFSRNFTPNQQIQNNTAPGVAPQYVAPARKPMFQGGLASAEDIGTLVDQGAIGTVKTPYGTVTLPNTIPAEQMAEFLPATASPLTNFGLPTSKPRPYLGGVMQAANRWRVNG